jgi:FdhE protein
MTSAMQRVLDPAQITAEGQRRIPRVRLPDPGTVFAARAGRLLSLSDGHPLAGYLALMSLLCDSQQRALDVRRVAGGELPAVLSAMVSQAAAHGMPLLPAVGPAREPLWREILAELCAAVATAPGFPGQVAATVGRLSAAPAQELERQADALLLAAPAGVDASGAPFVMAALQVCWTLRVAQLPVSELAKLPEVSTVCPVCGSLPVASVVHGDREYQGYRYLSCGLCATQWHMVRVKCSHCESTAGIHYESIEGGPEGIKAEACDQCHTYRKIFNREQASACEAVADDLASLALDLLLGEAGYHRASGNPLLWQPVGP